MEKQDGLFGFAAHVEGVQPRTPGNKVQNGSAVMMRLMLVLLVLGLALGGSGLYLMGFTDITHSGGIAGIGLVVALITLGVFLIVPAKIYIILRFTKTLRRSGGRE